mgnify:CR=1 FL=1
MESVRQQKIGRQLMKDLGLLFQQQGASLTGAAVLITVTKVKITPDLQLARTYLSIMGTENKADIVNTINTKAGEIRYMLGKKLRHQLKNIPRFQFYLDDSIDYIENINKLLDQ